MLTVKTKVIKKLTVTCSCGNEVTVPKSIAAKVLVDGNKVANSEEMKRRGQLGLAKRYKK